MSSSLLHRTSSISSPYLAQLPHRRASSLSGISRLASSLLTPSQRRHKDDLITTHQRSTHGKSAVQVCKALIKRALLFVTRRGPLVPLLAGLVLLAWLVFRSTPDEAAPTAAFNANGRSPNGAASKGRVRRLMHHGAIGLNNAKALLPDAFWAMDRWTGLSGVAGDAASLLTVLDVGREDLLWTPVSETPLADAVTPSKTARRDGRMLLIEGEEHPIPKLMDRAKKRWEALKGRQSKTFAQAVAEYKRRYGRKPPKGFDKWCVGALPIRPHLTRIRYAFARANNLKMIDEFDLIERDLHAFRALSPASFRARLHYLQEKFDFCWGIEIEKGTSKRTGELKNHQRAVDVEALHKRFVHALPDMLMWYSGHDIARTMISYEEKTRLHNLVKQRKRGLRLLSDG
jgi:hypothetical protein